MQAVIYTRVSLDRNGGRSVEDQERECRAECERSGWPVRAAYCDNSISASRYGKERPEWEKLKKTLRADDVLVMWEASRAQRDLEEWVRLRNICAKLGVLVSYSGKLLDLRKGDDRFVGGLDALLAERESEQFRERVLRGKRAGAAEGRPAGRLKWGYRVVSPGVWAPDPVEAPKVQESVTRLLRGESAYSVLQWLDTQEGYHPPTVTVLRRALRSPTYAGLRVHRGKVVGPGAWPALITEEQHRLLARRQQRQTPPGSPAPKHLLSGIATCGACERGTGWRKSRHGTPTYFCRDGHVTRRADLLDQLAEQRLFAGLAASPNVRQFDDSQDDVADIWRRIDALSEKLEEWETLAMNDEVSPEAFAKFERDLKRRIAALEEQIPTSATAWGDASVIAENWGEMDMRDRRAIIRAAMVIVIQPAARGHKVGTGGVEISFRPA